jgi:lipopolysaccharide-binding protein
MTVDLSITGTSKMGEDALPTASVVGCQFDVQDVDVRFHGGASWLYNLFKGSVENSIKKSMQGQVTAIKICHRNDAQQTDLFVY